MRENSKLYHLTVKDDTQTLFWCLGCGSNHSFCPDKTEWNHNDFSPTIHHPLKFNKDKKCHIKIENGKIHYYNDSEHQLSGKTVDMIDFHK